MEQIELDQTQFHRAQTIVEETIESLLESILTA
jgi:hypothetical protein